MPVAHIHIMEGRGDEKKERLIAEVTDAICRSLEVKHGIRAHHHPGNAKAHFGIGGVGAKKLGK